MVDVDDYKKFQIQAATNLFVVPLPEEAPEMGVDAEVAEQVVPPDEEDLACPVEGCDYVGKSTRGLAAHTRQAHPDL